MSTGQFKKVQVVNRVPLTMMELVWFQEGLDGPVQVGWGEVTGRRPDLAAAAGNRLFLFTASYPAFFHSATVDAGGAVLSLAVGLPFPTGDRMTREHVVLGLEDRLVVCGSRRGGVVRLWESGPEPGARFVDLFLADIDGDGKEEVVAAAEGKDALYFYRQADGAELRLELLAIRVLPGPAQKVVALERGGEALPLVVAAYRNNASSGLITLIYTEMGFATGPALESLPAGVTALAAGDFRIKPGEEPAWGGADGAIRVMEVDGQLTTAVTTDNLGSTVTALTAGRLAGGTGTTLLAGTPEGFLFGFETPVEKSAPDWASGAGRPVNSLAVSSEGLVGLGSSDGAVQVWLLSGRGRTVHTVRPGETLASVAALFQTTAAAIAGANGLENADLIFPGRKLIIP